MTTMSRILDFLEDRYYKYDKDFPVSFSACLLTIFYGFIIVGLFLGLPLLLFVVWVGSIYHIICMRQVFYSVIFIITPYVAWLLFIREERDL